MPIDWNAIPGAPRTKEGRNAILRSVIQRQKENAAAYRRHEYPPLTDPQEVAEEAVREQQRQQRQQRAEQFSRLPFGARVQGVREQIQALAEQYHAEALAHAREWGEEEPTLDQSTSELAERLKEDREGTLQELEEIAPGLAEHIAALQVEAPVRISDAQAVASHQFEAAFRGIPPTSANIQAVQEASMLASMDDNPEETAPLRAFQAIRQQGGTGALLDAMSIDEAIALAAKADALQARETPKADPFEHVPTEALEGFMKAEEGKELARQSGVRWVGESEREAQIMNDPTSAKSIRMMQEDIARMDREEAKRNPPKDDYRQYFETA